MAAATQLLSRAPRATRGVTRPGGPPDGQPVVTPVAPEPTTTVPAPPPAPAPAPPPQVAAPPSTLAPPPPEPSTPEARISAALARISYGGRASAFLITGLVALVMVLAPRASRPLLPV